MTQVVIAHRQREDGIIDISVNGDVIWVRTGVEIDISDGYIEALLHAGIIVSVTGPEAPEGFALVVDSDGNYVVDNDGNYIITEIA